MKQQVFENKSFDHCYGCTSCEQVCPFDAIKMFVNEEGFMFPKINTEKCTECNLCLRSCPTQDNVVTPLFHKENSIVYAAWCKNHEDLLESTSGGLFYILASKWIKEGGIVFGASYDENLHVKHIQVDNIDGLNNLRGSKYVQSNVLDTFKTVLSLLKQNKKVMYSGTPCQIAGLRAFLKKDYPNLITIDLVCHGVPSQKIFDAHKDYIESKYKSKLIGFKFRGKKESGWRAYVKYIFKNGKKISKFLGSDVYCKAFYMGWLSRLSCFSCEFSKGQRVGDITLSDFWGAEKHIPSLKKHRKYGFNLLICNSDKGQHLFESVKYDIEYLESTLDIAKAGDIRLRHTENKPELRDKTYQVFNEKGYQALIDIYPKEKFSISKLIPTFIKNIIKTIQAYT